MSPRARRLAGAALAVLFTVYFLGTVTSPPNSDDGGVTLGYIQRIAHGERLHSDFFDYYGPLTYLLPAFAYRLAGEQAIGVGLWMVVLKLLTLVAAHRAVRALASPFHAVLAVVVLGVLLGLPWPMFQIPYAQHLTLPLVLLVASWILPGEARPTTGRLALAAAATAAMLWIKISVGAFVGAAVLLHLFYWLPVDALLAPTARPAGSADASSESTLVRRGFRVAQIAGLVAYGVTFQRFVSEQFNGLYFAYLTGPLLLALATTFGHVVTELRSGHPVGPHIRAWALYLGSVIACSAVILLGFIGPGELGRYAHEQALLLQHANFVGGFAPIGAHGLFHGYGERYWPQLPWLFSLLYVAWVVARARGAVERAFGDAAGRAHARVTGVFVLVTLHTYVIYAVPDDAHLMQALLLVVPMLFVLLFHLEALVAPAARQRLAWRTGLAVASLLYASTLVFRPDEGAFRWGPGDFGNAHLAHLRYHPEWSRFASPVDPALSDRSLDRDLDGAARRIDALTDDGEEILVLAPLHLLYVASNTLPAPKRYGQLFYLLSHEMIHRAGFDALVPADERARLFAHPPRVIVQVHGDHRMLDALPELRAALESGGYRLVGKWGVLRVFMRDV